MSSSLGDAIEVQLAEANALTGSLLFKLAGITPMPQRRGPPRGPVKPGNKKPPTGKAKKFRKRSR